MSDQPIPQDATGTIIDQSPPATSTPTTETTVPTTETAPSDKPSLLNQPAPAGAPDAYAAWTLPEGYELDAGVTEEAGTIFKELGLSQAQGQKLVDLYSKHSLKTNEGLMDMVRQQNETWQNESKNHPELRGKLDPGGPVMTTISRALDGLGDAQLKADFRAAMDLTGAGNHPAFIRTFYRMAQRLAEGTHVAGNGPAPQGQVAPGAPRPTPARALYPNLPTAGG